MAQRRSKESIKRIALIGLGVALAGVVLYQVINSGPAPRPSRNSNANANRLATVPISDSSSKQARQAKPSTTAEQEAQWQALLADQSPLDLPGLKHPRGESKPGERGSVFAYYVEPQVPPKQPPPPPITLQGLQPPAAIAGTPRRITLMVFASKLPADASIFFNGAARATKRVSENQLSTDIEPSEYGTQGNITVEVRSLSDQKGLYSGPLQFTVQPAPEPQFRYIGRLGSLGQADTNYGVFEITANKEIKRAKRGDTVAAIWRIDSINADSVDLTNLQYEIKKRLPLQEKLAR